MDTYSDPGLAARYKSARELPGETLDLWMRNLVEAIPQRRIDCILDLGCGTGRFSEALAETFDCQVLACDPSSLMLMQQPQTSNVYRISAQAEYIPVKSESIDLIWMSQVFHHLSDSQGAFSAMNEVLAAGGVLAVRNGTKESDHEILWPDFFPEVAQSTFHHVATRSNILQAASRSGFTTLRVQAIEQLFVDSYDAYYERIRQRALSPLVELPDRDFEAGLRRMRNWVDAQPKNRPVYESIDLFVFQKTN
jgi:ubiquinone/menaquinone biosynthesis C-methylase UbiE